MHLAGQSFMAEARTRKNVCFNFGTPRLPTAPLARIAAPPDHIRIRLPALNYSECEKIRKIRPFVLLFVPVPLSLSLSFSYHSIAVEKLAKRHELDFSNVTA